MTCSYCPAPARFQACRADGPLGVACGRHAARMLDEILGEVYADDDEWRMPVKVERA